jgi:hypothetical protein
MALVLAALGAAIQILPRSRPGIVVEALIAGSATHDRYAPNAVATSPLIRLPLHLALCYRPRPIRGHERGHRRGGPR